LVSVTDATTCLMDGAARPAVYGGTMNAAVDATALSNLLHRYAESVDDGDFDGVGALFERARVFMSGPAGDAVSGGTAATIMRRFVRLYDGVPRTRHIVTNTVIEVDADRRAASARSYYMVLQILAAPLIVVTGRYHDRFGRDQASGEWYFTERVIHVDAVGDVSGHLVQNLPVTEEQR
jgi:3-phenylpropionate/cinnamic acid dioxygenase small subunit